MEIQKDGARVVGAPIVVPGARCVRLSSDGAAAYVLVPSDKGGDKLVTIDLTAARISQQQLLGEKARFLTTAADVPLLAVLSDGTPSAKMMLFSTSCRGGRRSTSRSSCPRGSRTRARSSCRPTASCWRR